MLALAFDKIFKNRSFDREEPIMLKEAVLFGQEIPHDKGIYSGAYIRPNEADPILFSEALPDAPKGALMGVGTLRMLFDASYGNFNPVILADYDNRVTCFNIKHLKLIKTIVEKYSKYSNNIQRFLYEDAMKYRWPKDFERSEEAVQDISKLERLEKEIPPFEIADIVAEMDACNKYQINDNSNEYEKAFESTYNLVSKKR